MPLELWRQREREKFLHHHLDRRNRGVLSDVLVLHQAFLCAYLLTKDGQIDGAVPEDAMVADNREWGTRCKCIHLIVQVV